MKQKSLDRRSAGIPGATNVHHVGFTVPDLNEAIGFFTDVLGCELVFQTGPFADADGPFMSENLNVDRHASLHVAMLRCGPVTNLELLEWSVPEQNGDHPRNSDVGAAHLAFQVADMATALAYLGAQPGVSILGEPATVPDGQPSAGSVFIYFLTPWGLQLELVTDPDDMPYKAATTHRMYGPALSWSADEAPADLVS